MGTAVEEINGATVVYPQGPRLDAAAASSFKSDMVDVIKTGAKRIILDLSQVDFMDSTGLASIMSTMKSLAGQGDMVLCGLSGNLKALFSLTKLDRGVFRIFESRTEALQAF